MYEDELRSLKEQSYRRLLNETEALAEDADHLYDPSLWTQHDAVAARVIRFDDPELDEQIDQYHAARDRCQAVLDESAMYADQFEHIGDTRGRGQIQTTRLKEPNSGMYPRTITLSDTLLEQSDAIVNSEDPEAFLTAFDSQKLQDILQSVPSVDDGAEYIWEKLENEPEIPFSNLADQYNLARAQLAQERDELETLVENRIQTELLAGYDRDDVPTYAS